MSDNYSQLDRLLGGIFEEPGAKLSSTQPSPRTFYRWEDGTTYWKTAAGDWMGAATFVNGDPDMENAGYVCDMDLTQDEVRTLRAYLDARAARPAGA